MSLAEIPMRVEPSAELASGVGSCLREEASTTGQAYGHARSALGVWEGMSSFRKMSSKSRNKLALVF